MPMFPFSCLVLRFASRSGPAYKLDPPSPFFWPQYYFAVFYTWAKISCVCLGILEVSIVFQPAAYTFFLSCSYFQYPLHRLPPVF